MALEEYEQGRISMDAWKVKMALKPEARNALARAFNVKADEIASNDLTTEGMNIMIHGVDAPPSPQCASAGRPRGGTRQCRHGRSARRRLPAGGGVMPTALPASCPRRLSTRQTARFAWLTIRQAYLARRIDRAGRRLDLRGEKPSGRMLHLIRRWLTCHADISTLLGIPEPRNVAEIRAALTWRRPDRSTFLEPAGPARTSDRAAAVVRDVGQARGDCQARGRLLAQAASRGVIDGLLCIKVPEGIGRLFSQRADDVPSAVPCLNHHLIGSEDIGPSIAIVVHPERVAKRATLQVLGLTQHEPQAKLARVSSLQQRFLSEGFRRA